MNYKIVIIDEAKIDFKEALLWYKKIDPKLAKRFHLSFKESLVIIKKNPFQIPYNNDNPLGVINRKLNY